MQAANLCFTGPLPVKSTKFLAQKRVPTPSRALFSFKAVANTATESSTVDYNTLTSVFPVEACDIIGGDACMGVMCPEAKISSSPNTGNARASEEDVEREYFEYSQQPKTVFPGEACDELGGEFCEADYQMGVYRDMALA